MGSDSYKLRPQSLQFSELSRHGVIARGQPAELGLLTWRYFQFVAQVAPCDCVHAALERVYGPADRSHQPNADRQRQQQRHEQSASDKPFSFECFVRRVDNPLSSTIAEHRRAYTKRAVYGCDCASRALLRYHLGDRASTRGGLLVFFARGRTECIERRANLRCGEVEVISIQRVGEGYKPVDLALHSRSALLIMDEEQRVFGATCVVGALAKRSEEE